MHVVQDLEDMQGSPKIRNFLIFIDPLMLCVLWVSQDV